MILVYSMVQKPGFLLSKHHMCIITTRKPGTDSYHTCDITTRKLSTEAEQSAWALVAVEPEIRS